MIKAIVLTIGIFILCLMGLETIMGIPPSLVQAVALAVLIISGMWLKENV